jgi:hypothetical protein
MRLAPKLLAGEHSHQGSASGMKRVENLNLKSQTPGIMTLVRRTCGIRRNADTDSSARRTAFR